MIRNSVIRIYRQAFNEMISYILLTEKVGVCMNSLNRNSKKMTRFLFIFYLIMLIWIIVFKFSFTFQDVPSLRSVNWVPFAGTAVRNNQLDYSEVLNNVLIFIPFGLYINMLKPEWNFLKKMMPIVLVSLAFEGPQYIFAIGATDITDLLTNTLGGVLGIVICLLSQKFFKNHSIKILNTVAMTGTLGISCLFVFLILANA